MRTLVDLLADQRYVWQDYFSNSNFLFENLWSSVFLRTTSRTSLDTLPKYKKKTQIQRQYKSYCSDSSRCTSYWERVKVRRSIGQNKIRRTIGRVEIRWSIGRVEIRRSIGRVEIKRSIGARYSSQIAVGCSVICIDTREGMKFVHLDASWNFSSR